jgi:hypothetical protein
LRPWAGRPTLAERHKELLDQAIATEARAQRELLGGDSPAAGGLMREASALYRESWQAAPPRAFGRLVGMLKSAVLAGDASEEAAYARAEIGAEGDSPASWYALGIAALVEGDDGLARRAAAGMNEGSDAFGRAATAIAALADRDQAAYANAVATIVADFEARADHLTGVPIADTALMLERLAARRGMDAQPRSELLPGW